MSTPLYFDAGQVSDLSRFFADEVAAGHYPFIDYDADDRWHQRIYRDRRMDVWLISWLPTQGTQLHDHGGSCGSFTVLTGELTESRPSGGVLVDETRAAGATVSFGAHYVHDVRNAGTEPAVSVHVYSAPLSSMTYYDLAEGRLQPIVTVETDDPEHELRVAS